MAARRLTETNITRSAVETSSPWTKRAHKTTSRSAFIAEDELRKSRWDRERLAGDRFLRTFSIRDTLVSG